MVALTGHANIYHFVAEDGSEHFSDQITDSRYKLLMRTGEPGVLSAVNAIGSKHAKQPKYLRVIREADRSRLDHDIAKAAQAHRVDAALLHAVVEVESGYNARAISPKGAMGLMQLMPATARRYGVIDALDASQNLLGGAHHLRDLLDQFAGNHELALAAYNAGAGAVLAHGRQIPPYAETQRYVPAVMQRYLAEKR
jgi:soluble lytic murein transglycosylase-like protein